MSKVGEKPISVPAGVNVSIAGQIVTVKGKEGELVITLPPTLTVSQEKEILKIMRQSDTGNEKALHGLYRSLLNNAVLGVEKPWEKRLEVVGTGYNVKLQGEDLVFKVGYSHIVTFKKQEGVKYGVEGNNKVIVKGVNKQLVGQVAYQIKLIKRPDAYKGKGIRFEGEQLRIKPGKKAKVAGAAA